MARIYPEILQNDSKARTFSIYRRTRKYKKGPIENWVNYKLKILGVHFLKRSICVTIDGHHYEPDLVYIDKSKGIYIDIEIDEPYTWNRKPCHYIDQNGISKDAERDDLFTSSGWIVIRFSERQIFSETISCVGVIAKVISQMDSTFESEHPKMVQWGNPTEEPRWTMEQSLHMAKQNFRKEYLGFTPGNINLIGLLKFANQEIGAIISGKWSR